MSTRTSLGALLLGARAQAPPMASQPYLTITSATKRAVVGAVSAGGANLGGMYRLNENFAAFIATGRAINPITKTNWEGRGGEARYAHDSG